MSIVRINAIEVPEGMGEVLEQRFAARLGAVDQAPGFEGFELLRPTGEAETRYFVVTHWRSVADFDAWLASDDFGRGHSEGGSGHGGGPVASGSAVLEFDVVLSSQPGS
jgi:heme-degrading monooxygenase HmoA